MVIRVLRKENTENNNSLPMDDRETPIRRPAQARSGLDWKQTKEHCEQHGRETVRRCVNEGDSRGTRQHNPGGPRKCARMPRATLDSGATDCAQYDSSETARHKALCGADQLTAGFVSTRLSESAIKLFSSSATPGHTAVTSSYLTRTLRLSHSSPRRRRVRQGMPMPVFSGRHLL